MRVRAGGGARRRAEALVKRLVAMPGVADVRYDRDWLTRVGAGLGTIRAAGLALALLMALAAAVTVATVVRLGLHAATGRNRDHGARRGAAGLHPRARSWPKGCSRAGSGRCSRIAALWVGFLVAMAWWGTDLNSLLDGGIRAIPADSALCCTLMLGGMLVGSAGGLVAPACRVVRPGDGLVDRSINALFRLESHPGICPRHGTACPAYLTDSRLPASRSFYSVTDFYREEFVKCQRCLDQQREYYSEHAIRDVEQALVKVMSQLDRLCAEADADQVVSRLLRQFDVVTGLSAWTDPRQVH